MVVVVPSNGPGAVGVGEGRSFPARAGHAPGQSLLDPHVVWLQQQLAAGKDNASALWRELRERGFSSGPRQVLHWVNQHRLLPSKRTPYCRRPANATWRCIRRASLGVSQATCLVVLTAR